MGEGTSIAVVGVDAIGGAMGAAGWSRRLVGEFGRRHGIPTPLNDALTALLAPVDAPPRP